jgi:hypothetical protein
MVAAEQLRNADMEVAWLVSPRAADLIYTTGSEDTIWNLGPSRNDNLATWNACMATYHPNAVVFADYPLLFLAETACPLWSQSDEELFLRSGSAVLLTFDHLGLTDIDGTMQVGLSTATEVLESITVPSAMRVLRPCPLHDPRTTARGCPVRSTDVTPLTPDQRENARQLFGIDPSRPTALYAVPAWASKLDRAMGGGFYARLRSRLLRALPPTARLIWVSEASPAQIPRPDNRIIDCTPLPPGLFRLLQGSVDLFVTDNPTSRSLAQAIGLQTASLVVYLWPEGTTGGWASGPAVNPAPDRTASYDMFPVLPRGQLRRLGVTRSTAAADCFTETNIEATNGSRPVLEDLLLGDSLVRRRQRDAQRSFNEAVDALPSFAEMMADLCSA